MDRELRDYPSVKEYLYGLKHHGAKYGIDRMQLFSEALGRPDQRFPIIHIAGTNGKGSTAAMLESIYRSAGYKTGLFTSPHLVHQGERIQVNRRILSHQRIIELTRHLKPVAEELGRRNPDDHPSFFEFMTAMAFLTFAEEQVDVGIVEVGLGGRLDATNIVMPELSVITTVSYDHTEILGETLTEIAREKAGIIKPGRPVLIGRLAVEAETEIRRIAAERSSPLSSVREIFGDDEKDYPATNLLGRHQRWNAGTAVAAARLLQNRIHVSEEQLARGLLNVSWAGRWDERHLADRRTIVFDAAHNEEGAAALEENLSKLVERTGRRPVVLVGALGERRAKAVIATVARYAREIVLLRPSQLRASDFEVLEAAVPKDFKGTVRRSTVRDVIPSPGHCAVGGSSDCIVATGSIYLLGELMEALEYAAPVNEHTLQD